MSIICIRLDHAEGSLPRLIGLIERRGFLIEGLEMSAGLEDRSLVVTVRPRDGTRCINVLGRQIDRLYGLRRISNLQPGDESCLPTL